MKEKNLYTCDICNINYANKEKAISELENLKKCYLGSSDAIMKPISFESYIQEIIDLLKLK